MTIKTVVGPYLDAPLQKSDAQVEQKSAGLKSIKHSRCIASV